MANPTKVRILLWFLFENHSEFIRRKSCGELELSKEALRALQAVSKLTEVVDDVEYEETAPTRNLVSLMSGEMLLSSRHLSLDFQALMSSPLIDIRVCTSRQRTKHFEWLSPGSERCVQQW